MFVAGFFICSMLFFSYVLSLPCSSAIRANVFFHLVSLKLPYIELQVSDSLEMLMWFSALMCPPAPARSSANLPCQPKEARSASVALHRFDAGIWCFGKARAKTISWDAHLLAVITRTDCCAFQRDSSQGLLSTIDGWSMHPSLNWSMRVSHYIKICLTKMCKIYTLCACTYFSSGGIFLTSPGSVHRFSHSYTKSHIASLGILPSKAKRTNQPSVKGACVTKHGCCSSLAGTGPKFWSHWMEYWPQFPVSKTWVFRTLGSGKQTSIRYTSSAQIRYIRAHIYSINISINTIKYIHAPRNYTILYQYNFYESTHQNQQHWPVAKNPGLVFTSRTSPATGECTSPQVFTASKVQIVSMTCVFCRFQEYQGGARKKGRKLKDLPQMLENPCEYVVETFR